MKIYKNLTWKNGYKVRLGIKGNRIAAIPQEIAAKQKEYDGKTFLARLLDGRKMRVRLVGDDYDLFGSGTGDMVVRPMRYVD